MKKTIAAALSTLLISGLLGLAAPAANAAPVITANFAAGGHYALDANMAQVPWTGTPDSYTVDVLQGGICSDGELCYSTQVATKSSQHDQAAQFHFDKLLANVHYRVEIISYSQASGQQLYYSDVITAKEAPKAPTLGPLASTSKDGLKAQVRAQAEYSDWNVQDGTPLSALRYNIYAYVGGKPYKQVATNVAANKLVTVSGLPQKKAITFKESSINSIGESEQSAASGSIKLGPVAPGSFTGKTLTYTTKSVVSWKAPTPGSGHIVKYRVKATLNAKVVWSKSLSSKARHVTVSGLKRHKRYLITITAYNSYKKTSTIYGWANTQ